MNRKEILEAIDKVDFAYKETKKQLAEAKRAWTEIETLLIEIKLRKEHLVEALRVDSTSVPSSNVEVSLRDQEVERFRKDYPELVQLAKERDEKRGQ